jgi:hypothetical protein
MVNESTQHAKGTENVPFSVKKSDMQPTDRNYKSTRVPFVEPSQTLIVPSNPGRADKTYEYPK